MSADNIEMPAAVMVSSMEVTSEFNFYIEIQSPPHTPRQTLPVKMVKMNAK